MSNTNSPKLQGDGAVFSHGQLVGYRREVTPDNVMAQIYAARGHRNGSPEGPRQLVATARFWRKFGSAL